MNKIAERGSELPLGASAVDSSDDEEVSTRNPPRHDLILRSNPQTSVRILSPLISRDGW